MKINVTGNVKLREDYTNPNNIKYYAIVEGTFVSTRDYDPPKVEIAVPITDYQYEILKKNLNSSDHECPQLKVEGDLEIILGGINIIC